MAYSTAPIIVRGLPPVWGTPSPSPFVIKLLTWLRMAKIDHELRPLASPPRSTTKKIPYVEMPNGEIVSDSGRIIARLSTERAIDLDAGLDDAARATARLLEATFEGHLYFAALYERFVTREGWAFTRRDYFRAAPMAVRTFAPLIIRRGAIRNLYGQGTGRLARADVAELARRDLQAIATTLGSRPYFLGAAPHTIDATALGFLWAISSHPWESACRDAIESHATLVAYVSRMREHVWSGFSG